MAQRIYNNAGYQAARTALVPAATDSYSPIPHSYFLDDLARQINETQGLQVRDRRIYTNLAGTKLVGFFPIQHYGIESDPRFGLEMMIGFKNSYDKSMAAALAAGANVIVCGNGVVAGDMLSFKRKHTGAIAEELREKATQAIQSMVEGFSILLSQVDIMQNYVLTQRDKSEILGVLYFEENIVKPNQLSIIKKEMYESLYFRGDTLWDLYNNVTESLKRSHPMTHIEDHIHLHNFMCDIANITATEDVEADYGKEADENFG